MLADVSRVESTATFWRMNSAREILAVRSSALTFWTISEWYGLKSKNFGALLPQETITPRLLDTLLRDCFGVSLYDWKMSYLRTVLSCTSGAERDRVLLSHACHISMIQSCVATKFFPYFLLNIPFTLVGFLVSAYHTMQSASMSLEKIILMPASKTFMQAPRNMPLFMARRRMLDTKKNLLYQMLR